MKRRLLAGFLSFTAVIVLILEIPLGISFANSARQAALSEIERDASSLALLVGGTLQRGDATGANAIVQRFSHDEHAIVAVVSGRGIVLTAGTGAVEELGDPDTKLIVREAESGREVGEEGSKDPDDDFLYVAIPISFGTPGSNETHQSTTGEKVGVVMLIAVPAAPVHAQIDRQWFDLALFGACILAVAAAIGAVLANSLTRPLSRIESAVARLADGQLSARVELTRGPVELVKLRATVNSMAERTEDLMNAQRAFAADASHQLRAPLTALRLRLENIEECVEESHEAEWGSMLAEVERLSRVVDGLLALARSEGARPARMPVDVDAAIHERVGAWNALSDERGVVLMVDDAVHPSRRAALVALAGAGFFEQVLDNLLANALDATPPRGIVAVRASRVNDWVEIHVTDEGTGMSAAERARAFDRFWRSDRASHDGAGLGLAIVAQLVRASEGSVWLDASPSGGVDAVVRLSVA